MKRYLIYGFLTILIITLNFAFIIVLATDNVRINYRVLFLLWLVVILAAAGLAYLEKTKKNRESAVSTLPAEKNSRRLSDPKEAAERFSHVYRNKCIKKFKILLAEDLTTKLEPGFFGGYVQNEDYGNETVQAVYTSDEQLLGYINKNKKKLCQNIETLYDDPVTCWGEIQWDNNENRFCLKAYVPVLYSEPEQKRFRKMVALKEELLQMEKDAEKMDTYDYLEKAENFYYLQQSEITHSSLDHAINFALITALSKKLYDKKEWKELVELKKFPVVISRLKQPEKKEIISRVEKGEKKMQA